MECTLLPTNNLRCIDDKENSNGVYIPDDSLSFEVAVQGNVLRYEDKKQDQLGFKMKGTYDAVNNAVYWDNKIVNISKASIASVQVKDFIWTKSGIFCRYVYFSILH